MRSLFTVLQCAMFALPMLTACGLKKEKATEIPPVKVVVISVDSDTIGNSISYSGTVESADETNMSFLVGGTLRKLYVNEGQHISKGQLLAEVDPSDATHASNIAQATLNEARDAYERMKKLHDADALPDIKWVEVQQQLKQAENAAAIASKQVSDTKIYSPINGVVSQKFAEVGQTVGPGIPVVSVVSLNDIRVKISVPENRIATMQPGMNATITIDALPETPISGTLTEQGVVADPLSRTYSVKFDVSNPEGKLLPGMLCNVTVENPMPADSSSTSIVLPSQAVLLSADNRNFVWLAKKGIAERRFVTISDMTPRGIEIASGLVPGDSVITQGMQKISNGSKLQY